MKKFRLIITLFTFIFMNLSSAQENFILDADHLALQVKDLSKSVDFYEKVLGLKEIDNAGLGKGFRWFELKSGYQIHLIESNQNIEKYKGVHLALNTSNLDAFRSHLESKNVHYENWPGKKNEINVRPDGIRQIYFQDPDGYWIEVNDNK